MPKIALIPDLVMNDFCYPYARLLLDKLDKLISEHRLYTPESNDNTNIDPFYWPTSRDSKERQKAEAEYKLREEASRNDPDRQRLFTEIARLVFRGLHNQIGLDEPLQGTPNSVAEYRKVAEEYISIFETKG